MKKKSKILRNFIVFILLIVLTFYVILKDEDVLSIFNILKNVKIGYILIAVLCMVMYIALDAVNIGRLLKTLKEKSTFLKNVKYSLIGFFFSSITPAATGGQPMQIYYMHKDKIAVANSTLTFLINLTCMQVVTITFALVSVIFNYMYLNKALIICLIIGIFLNLSALSLLIIGISSKKMSKWLVNFSIKVLNFFRVKNTEQKRLKFEAELEKYQESARYIKNNKVVMLKTLFTTFVQYICYYSIAYFVYRAFGFSSAGILKIITMQSMVYGATSGIPSPGAVGVSEGAFIEVFKHIYPATVINSAVIVSRGVNFYLFVLISGIVSIINDIKSVSCKQDSELLEEKIG